MNIACVEPLGISAKQFEELKADFARHGHYLDYHLDRKEDAATLVQRMKDVDIVVISNIPLSAAVLAQCPMLQMLSVAFTGLDHIDLDYCRQHNIQVCNAAGYSTVAVSELAVALMIDVLRHITELDGTLRQGIGKGSFLGHELHGRTVGVVGTGAIGTAVIRLLLAFGCHVLAYNRSEHADVKQLGVQYVPLPTLMKESDIVTLHVPLNADTYHLISTSLLAMMKPTAILINTARGNVVDIPALAAALQAKQIAGAGIDVYDQEPPLPSSHPLLSAPHCVCLPHVGFATREAFDIRAGIVFDNVKKFLHIQ